jgi:hypothetical protein
MHQFEHESFFFGNGNGYQTETNGAFPESSHIIFQYVAEEESVALEKESLAKLGLCGHGWKVQQPEMAMRTMNPP